MKSKILKILPLPGLSLYPEKFFIQKLVEPKTKLCQILYQNLSYLQNTVTNKNSKKLESFNDFFCKQKQLFKQTTYHLNFIHTKNKNKKNKHFPNKKFRQNVNNRVKIQKQKSKQTNHLNFIHKKTNIKKI